MAYSPRGVSSLSRATQRVHTSTVHPSPGTCRTTAPFVSIASILNLTYGLRTNFHAAPCLHRAALIPPTVESCRRPTRVGPDPNSEGSGLPQVRSQCRSATGAVSCSVLGHPELGKHVTGCISYHSTRQGLAWFRVDTRSRLGGARRTSALECTERDRDDNARDSARCRYQMDLVPPAPGSDVALEITSS